MRLSQRPALGSGRLSVARRRLLPLAAVAAATALVLAGCTSGAGGGNGSSTKPDTGATVNVGLVLEPTDLDIRTTSGIALEQVLIDNVYQGLVGRTSTNGIVNVLAKSHTISTDGLTYTFTLQQGVKFDDGAAMTAADVVWSLEQVKDTPTFQNTADLADVTSISSPSADTVQLKLKQPDSGLLWALSGRAGLVLEKAATNDLKTTANGTGPYKLQNWKQGDSIHLVRNSAYWGKKAKVAGVVFKYYTSPSAAINAVQSGDVDVQTAVDPTLSAQLKGSSDIALKTGKTTDKYTLAFNNKVAPFTDIRVRKAIREAIDTKALIKALGGAGVRQGGPIPELDPGYENLDSVDAYDPANAKKLLKEAGKTDLTLTLEYPNIYPASIGDVLTTQLKAVGITLKVKQVDFTTWLNDVFTVPKTGLPTYQLSMVDHAESHDFGEWADPSYYFGYDNKEVQTLYAESQTATTQAEADAKLRQAAKIVADDAPAEWLYTATTITAIHSGITGFPTSSTSARLNLANLAKS
ncbi:ABC transporter substrate-binding protein [Frondihabitans australicus]|uniref:Peptide/nickel transport system substrate-binding protein n=1 Tax=Frondihabitans australicus TaxID=386892 RepID=A0A495ICM7_9MICO|nr:ABC transporter substrate-binding protein [Frondihabitans australicus]RKR73763.1 peptide/nickel transport system substrate-binding protein [Frondihabitans australicus]